MNKFSVHEIYKNSKTAEVPLLSNFNGDFWVGYLENYERFDNMYARMYYSFIYYNKLVDENDSMDNIRISFTNDVYNILMKNSKKYSELFRIQNIPDDESYSVINDFNKHEVYSGNNNVQSAEINGQRTDVTIDNIGEQNSADLNKVTGWDSGTENTKDSNSSSVGTREDTHQFTKGQEENTARSAEQSSHNIRVYGNVGMAPDEVLKKHYNFWNLFNFYETIFNDICEELLLIGGDGYDC